MADIFDLSNLNSALGEKCSDPDVKRDFLTSMMYQPAFENRVEVIEDAIDEIPLPIMQFDDPLAPLGDAESVDYKSQIVTADARVLKVKDCIVAVKIVPWKLRATYLATMQRENLKRKANKQDPFYLPFEDFILGKIMEKATEKLYMSALFLGERDDNGTDSVDMLDGFLKQITDVIDDNDLTEVATGALSSSNVYEKLLAVYDAFGENVKQGQANMHVAPAVFDWMQRITNPLTNSSIFLPRSKDELLSERLMNAMLLPGTNAILYREPGMGSSKRVIATAPGNLFLGFHNDPRTATMEIQKSDLTLKFLFAFKAGAQVGLVKDTYGALKVNDQA